MSCERREERIVRIGSYYTRHVNADRVRRTGNIIEWEIVAGKRNLDGPNGLERHWEEIPTLYVKQKRKRWATRAARGSLYAAKLLGLECRWDEARKCWDKAGKLGFDYSEPYAPS